MGIFNIPEKMKKLLQYELNQQSITVYTKDSVLSNEQLKSILDDLLHNGGKGENITLLKSLIT